ncbi:hypothetical protein JQ593_22795 [Bradyrhizobium viridifuturi]|jgi:hypothetical protein|nr:MULTISPECIES: hypothetical protein [Bacteria]MBR1038916.1 hypothetical protein [Bradyrhizobium viridifuturi]MCA3704564.1 hypothetical protein [Methylobacterium sp.]MEE4417573.1 hypothetical protein [Klebsiella pneumoniae]OYU64061.1 MAG: hypothetical protein CFE30_00135 [Bradyrhizobium sp. PARBB1]PCL30601.1 hypothetical protein CPZ06_10080 [Lactobacillus acidophilus]PCL41235.1 hypothetical protein CPZ10_15700 [Lacticaseibacillus rhamnosus]POE73282.1 hypothetical protein CFP56_75233 [Quercu
MLTPEQAADIRARDEALHAWMKARKTNSYHPSELPPHINPPTNDERGQVELFEFMRDIPERYFLYINAKTNTATTWNGERLGSASFGREYRDNFGGKRVPVTVRAINGATYHGTYFKSAGDYARVKKAKG